MACDPNQLMEDTKCILSCIPPGAIQAAQLRVLCDIADAGSGGNGTCCVAPDTMDPEGVKTADPGATYLNLTDNSFWVKRTGSGDTGWLELIAMLMVFLGLSLPAFAQPPIQRTPLTTNQHMIGPSLVDGASPIWNATANKWSNNVISASGTPGGAEGNLQVNMGSSFVGSTNSFYDVTNSTLSIGTNQSFAKFHVRQTGTNAIARFDSGVRTDVVVINTNGTTLIGQNYITRTNTDNVQIGNSAGFSSVGSSLVQIGTFSGQQVTNGSSMVQIGRHAGFDSFNSDNAIQIGHAAGQWSGNASSSVQVGYQAARFSTNGFLAVAVGGSAGQNNPSIQTGILIGYEAGMNGGSEGAATAVGAVMMGYQAGRNVTSGQDAIMIGDSAGANATNAQNSILIGYQAGKNLNANNRLVIDSNAATATNGSNAMIYAELDNRILQVNNQFATFKTNSFGVGTNDPKAAFHVAGLTNTCLITSPSNNNAAPFTINWDENTGNQKRFDIFSYSGAAPQIAQLNFSDKVGYGCNIIFNHSSVINCFGITTPGGNPVLAAEISAFGIPSVLKMGPNAPIAPSAFQGNVNIHASPGFLAISNGTGSFASMMASNGLFTGQVVVSNTIGVVAAPLLLRTRGTGIASGGGTIIVSNGPIASAGTAETNLITATISAHTLTNTNDRLIIRTSGRFAANANAKQLKLIYGSETILDTGSQMVNSGAWTIEAEIIRIGNTAQTSSAEFHGAGVTLFTTSAALSTAQTNGIDTVLKMTSTAAGDGDVTNRTMTVEWWPSP